MQPKSLSCDRDRTVVVVVDIQERLAAAMERRERVIDRTRLLVRAAAIVGAPIVVTRQYPKGLGDLEPEVVSVIEEVRAAGATVHEVDKLTFDCFATPEFADVVAATGCDQLVLAGMETHICVVQTAVSGLEQGMDVFLATDACCSREEENRSLATARMAHAGCVVSSVESVAYELVGAAGTDEFKRLLAAVKG